jgi:enoyl-CoA hydratase/carnithine racemase
MSVSFSVAGAIARITLERPEALNALDRAHHDGKVPDPHALEANSRTSTLRGDVEDG